MRETSRESLVTLRSLAIGIALIPLTTLWVIQSEVIWYSGHPTTTSLYYHVVFVMLLLSCLNFALGKWAPRHVLEPRELLTVYLVLTVSSTLCSHDFLQIMVPLITHVTWHASSENQWADLFLNRHVPPSLLVAEHPSMRGFFEGGSTLYQVNVLTAWIGPLLIWSTFVFAMMLAMIFLNNLFRKQWTENERLAYPILEIPIAISSRLRSLLTSKVFWYGFAIAAIIQMVNQLNVQFPSVPAIPVIKAFNFGEYLVERPWNAIGTTWINLYPFAIGLCFFLPTDLAFSCWFFFFFWRLVRVISAMIGAHGLPGFPYINQQTAGGYLALGAIAIWISRKHLLLVLKKVMGRPVDLDESNEPMSYRKSFVGFILCTLYLIGFGVGIGANPLVMTAFFLIFYGYCIAIARMRAELGPPAHDLHNAGPDILLTDAFGPRTLGAGNLSAFSLFFFFNRAYRANMTATSLEGYKIGERLGIRSRALFWTMVIAVIVGIPAAYWALLHSFHQSGTTTAVGVGDIFGRESWMRLQGWMQNPQSPNIGATIGVFVGFGICCLLAALRMRFTWWMLHPVGFATSASWSMENLWTAMLIAWLIKWLLLRYGGAKAYRPAVPFFIGLVLGDFLLGSIWNLYGVILGKPVYHFWG